MIKAQIPSEMNDNESFAPHTEAYPELMGAFNTFLEGRKHEMCAKKFDNDTELIEWTIRVVLDFLRDDNAYLQKLTSVQRTLAYNCIMLFGQLCNCRNAANVAYCSYDDVITWNSGLRERAGRRSGFFSGLCLSAATKCERFKEPHRALNSVADNSDFRALKKSLETIRLGESYGDALRDFVVGLDSFIAKNVVTRPVLKGTPEMDKKTLELIQGILGFLHAHGSNEDAKMEEEQISIFLEEHSASVVWPSDTDTRSSERFFVSYDSALTAAKDIRPCITCGKTTLRGSRILPSAD